MSVTVVLDGRNGTSVDAIVTWPGPGLMPYTLLPPSGRWSMSICELITFAVQS